MSVRYSPEVEKKWDTASAICRFQENISLNNIVFIVYKNILSILRPLPYNILIQFLTVMQLVRLIRMCRNEAHAEVRTGKHSSHIFPTHYDLKLEDTSWQILLSFACDTL